MISEVLVPELDEEIGKTRRVLERVPSNADYSPHTRSMPLGKLAAHVAQLPSFGLTVLTAPQLNFSAGSYKPLDFESAQQLVRVLEEGAAQVRAALLELPDAAWQENWKLTYEGKTLFESSRYLAYRGMFLNHLVHHRAQVGVYLRMNEVPVPALYGPSADEPINF